MWLSVACSIVRFQGANGLVQVRTVVRYAPNCLPVSYFEANQTASLGLSASYHVWVHSLVLFYIQGSNSYTILIPALA